MVFQNPKIKMVKKTKLNIEKKIPNISLATTLFLINGKIFYSYRYFIIKKVMNH